MHDPMTVAFEIKYPWPRYPLQRNIWGGLYRDTFLTIWHVDPEIGGSGDSCGWSRAKISESGERLAEEMAKWEMDRPYFFTCPSRVRDRRYRYHQVLPGDCFALVLGIISTAAWRLHEHRMSPDLMVLAANLSVIESDNLQACFALDSSLTEYQRTEKIKNAFYCVIRHYENSLRPWYRHPRWHLRHWSLQLHPLQNFKRWAFSRCKFCRKGFAWGDHNVIGYSWDSGGPRWFGSEDIAHCTCDASRIQPGISSVA